MLTLRKKAFICFVFVTGALVSCKNTSTTEETKATAPAFAYAPKMNGSTVFDLVQKQVDFGPRVPGTAAHKACGNWMVEELKSSGLEVTEQTFQAANYLGKTFQARNIIAAYNPAATKRILLAAHWDTRALADKDTERQSEPIPGANDGGSGVGILLEVARKIKADSVKPNIGIDFIFFDAEDWGAPESFKGNSINDYGGYCLGSEYWSKNPHQENYTAYFGILLDMVGAKGAKFSQEATSLQVAPSIVKKIWQTASQLGYGAYFINAAGATITDDHWPIIQNRKIPMVDIIDLQGGPNKVFFDGHHTHADSMDSIDPNVLNAVGNTVLQVIYNEGSK